MNKEYLSVKIRLLISALGALSLLSCSSEGEWTNVGDTWKEESGLEKIVLKQDAVETKGVIVTPVKVLNARMVDRDGTNTAIHADGYEFFYLCVRNTTSKGGYINFVVRYKLSFRDSNNKNIDESSVIEKKYRVPCYPNGMRYIQSSFPDTPPESESINEEYNKLLSVLPEF